MFFNKTNQNTSDIKAQIEQQNREREKIQIKLSESDDQLAMITIAAKQLINSVTLKLQSKLHPSPFTRQDEGVAFINWRGDLLQANGTACELLHSSFDELKSQKIAGLYTVDKNQLSLEQCSETVMKMFSNNPDRATKRELKLFLNEPIKLVFHRNNQTYSLRAVFSLFETNPKTIDQVTYMVKLHTLEVNEVNIPEFELAI